MVPFVKTASGWRLVGICRSPALCPGCRPLSGLPRAGQRQELALQQCCVCKHSYYSVTRVVSSVRTRTGINTVWCCKCILSQPSSTTCTLLVTAGWGPGSALYFIVCLCVYARILYICMYLYIYIYICLHFLRPYFFRIV